MTADQSSLQALRIETPETSTSVRDFEFVGLVSETLREFKVLYYEPQSEPPPINCFALLEHFKSLTVFHLQTYTRLELDEKSFSQLLMYCPRIEELELTELKVGSEGKDAYRGTPSEAKEEAASGIQYLS